MMKQQTSQANKTTDKQERIILSMKNVTKKFGGIVAVSNFNLDLREGELLGLIGPNGAGKTTVFNLITHVFPVTEGKIEFLGRDITKLSTDKIIRLGIARTFQNIRLFGSMTVEENILTGFHAHLKSNIFSSVAFLPGYQSEEKYFKEKAEELMKDLGIEQLANFQGYSVAVRPTKKVRDSEGLSYVPKTTLT